MCCVLIDHLSDEAIIAFLQLQKAVQTEVLPVAGLVAAGHCRTTMFNVYYAVNYNGVTGQCDTYCCLARHQLISTQSKTTLQCL